MKDLTPKSDSTAGPTGQYIADDFNDLHNDVQNSVIDSGQALAVTTLSQMLNAIAVGGRRKIRSTGETADIGDLVLPDNSSGAVTIKLPTTGLFVNATVDFEQIDDLLFSTNELIVDPDTNMIMGDASTMTVDSITSDNIKFRMSWKGGSVGWVVSKLSVVGNTL